jgi:magnesium transporter
MIRIYGSFAGARHDLNISVDLLPALLKEPGAILWIVLDHPTHDEVEKIAKIFHFHPLSVEDCMAFVELPKIDEFEDHAFIITHGLKINEDGDVEKVELDCFIGKNWLVTAHLVPSRSVTATREKVERQPELLSRGADFLLHSVLDLQVDNYMPLIDNFDREIDRLEEEVLEHPRQELLGEILNLRRQVAKVRRSIGPQRDVIGRLARHDLDFISPKASIYFRDIYDHVVRVHEMLEGIRDVIGGLTESYRGMISQRLNEVMQKLTTISTLFLPMTFIASIYGMNFHHMPELDRPWGYPLALGVMAMVGGGFFIYFKSKRWV